MSGAELWDEGPALASADFKPGALEDTFGAPPFTVLDTRQGYWQERRRGWLSLGIKSELGRGAGLISDGALVAAEQAREKYATLPTDSGEGGLVGRLARRRGWNSNAVGGEGDLAAPMRDRMTDRKSVV